jgi:2-keto-3-deoxy-L-rhamnonate aldolase RhmA
MACVIGNAIATGSAGIRHELGQTSFKDVAAINVIERLRVADLDHILQSRGIDLPKHGLIADELRDVGHFHSEMDADRLQEALDDVIRRIG